MYSQDTYRSMETLIGFNLEVYFDEGIADNPNFTLFRSIVYNHEIFSIRFSSFRVGEVARMLNPIYGNLLSSTKAPLLKIIRN